MRKVPALAVLLAVGMAAIVVVTVAERRRPSSSSHSLESATPLPTQQAEAIFQKIEETVTKARTLRIHYKSVQSGTGGAPTYEMSGTLLLKEGNKVLETFTWGVPEDQRDVFYASDGTNAAFGFVYVRGGALRSYEFGKEPTPEALTEKLGLALVRFGHDPYTNLSSKTLFTARPDYPCDPKTFRRLSNFTAGPDDGGLMTLSYKLTSPHGLLFDQAKIWYEPTTYKMLKRTLTFDVGGDPSQERSLTETYQEWTLNVAIADESFKLPEEKFKFPREKK